MFLHPEYLEMTAKIEQIDANSSAARANLFVTFAARETLIHREWKSCKSLVYMTIHGKEEDKDLTNRNKNLQLAYILAIGAVLMLSSSRAFATNDENHIQEIM